MNRMNCRTTFFLYTVLGALIFLFSMCGLLFAAEGTGDYIHYRLGVKYKNEKKYDKAIDEFRKVLAAYPDNYNAYYHMAEIRADQNRSRLVIYNLKKALNYNPGWSRAQKMLAVAYEKDGQYQKAILELQQYQQVSDPAERDSIQRHIDRLIGVVSKTGTTITDTSGDTAREEPLITTATGGTDTTTTGKINETSSTKPAAITEQKKTRKKTSARVPVSDVAGGEADSVFMKVVECYNQEKFDDALKLLRTVLALKPGHPGAYFYAGLIRYRKKQNQKAIANFTKGLAYEELGHNAHYYLGKMYGEEGHYAQAITHLFKYIEKTTYAPGKKEAEQLIVLYRKKGGAAVLDAIAPGPQLPLTPGDTLSPQEYYYTFEVRIDSLLTMITVDTLSDAGRNMLDGIRAFTAGAYDKAIQEFKKILSMNPSGTIAAQCLYNTGICYLKMRLFKEAGNQFQQIVERYPHHQLASNSLFLKSLTYLEQSEPVTAEKLLRSFIQKHRKHPWISNAFEKLGDAYMDLEQPKKAVDAYTQAVALTRNNTDKLAMLFKLGKAYGETGNSSRAMEAYNRVIATGEKANIVQRVPDSYYRIADELYRMKEYSKALEYYKKVTRKYPTFQETPWGIFQIGSINKNTKKYQDAIDAFKELIRRYPDDYWARQAQWKMEDAIWEHEYKAVLR